MTALQERLLLEIRAEIALTGHPPTVRALADRMGVRAHSQLWGELHRMEMRGEIARVDGKYAPKAHWAGP